MTKTTSININLTPLFWLGIIFIVFKLTPVNDWPWGVVLLPFYPLIAFYIFALGVILALSASHDVKWTRKR